MSSNDRSLLYLGLLAAGIYYFSKSGEAPAAPGPPPPPPAATTVAKAYNDDAEGTFDNDWAQDAMTDSPFDYDLARAFGNNGLDDEDGEYALAYDDDAMADDDYAMADDDYALAYDDEAQADDDYAQADDDYAMGDDDYAMGDDDYALSYDDYAMAGPTAPPAPVAPPAVKPLPAVKPPPSTTMVAAPGKTIAVPTPPPAAAPVQQKNVIPSGTPTALIGAATRPSIHPSLTHSVHRVGPNVNNNTMDAISKIQGTGLFKGSEMKPRARMSVAKLTAKDVLAATSRPRNVTAPAVYKKNGNLQIRPDPKISQAGMDSLPGISSQKDITRREEFSQSLANSLLG